MKKKVLSIILALSMMFSLAAVTSITASAETFGDFEYDVLDDGTVEITSYTGSAEKLDIPDTLDGKTVTSIGYGAFENCTSLTSVTIPDSVISIGDSAFANCILFTSIAIPNNVTSIGNGAFRDCYSLSKVSIGNGITNIGEDAFYQTNLYYDESNWENGVLYIGKYLIETKDDGITDDYQIKDGTKVIADSAFDYCDSITSITIPGGVTNIGNGAFYNCESLTSVTIPNSVTSIGDYAFAGCVSFTSITIPDSVTNIGHYAFGGCHSLSSITIPDSITSIDGSAFNDTSFYYEKSNWENNVLYIGKYLIYAEGNRIVGNYQIKNGTKVIADGAFSDCTSLTIVTIPDSVTSIGDFAFSGCESLSIVMIPNSVTSIGNGAFYNCTMLKSITIPNSVTSIGTSAFAGCTSLKSVTIGYCVEKIGQCAFLDCTSLNSITIPDCVTEIGNATFGYYEDYYNREKEYYKIPGFHIYCYPDTAAEQYAINNEFDYTLLKEVSLTIEQPTAGIVKKTDNSDGTITLTASANKLASFTNWVIDGEYEIVEGSLTSETITIRPKADGIKISTVFDLPSTSKYGDVNYDGNIDMLDVLLMRKYIAKQPIDLDTNLADVNCDDNVNMLDVLLMRKYIAKQPVTLGPKG